MTYNEFVATITEENPGIDWVMHTIALTAPETSKQFNVAPMYEYRLCNKNNVLTLQHKYVTGYKNQIKEYWIDIETVCK